MSLKIFIIGVAPSAAMEAGRWRGPRHGVTFGVHSSALQVITSRCSGRLATGASPASERLGRQRGLKTTFHDMAYACLKPYSNGGISNSHAD